MNRKRYMAQVKQSSKQVQTPPREISAQELRASAARLAHDLSRSEKIPNRAPKIHTQVQAALPLYLAAQQQGQDAAISYPEIAAHLRVCQACRTHYELAYEIFESLQQSKAPARVNNSAVPPYPNLWRKIEFPAGRAQKEKVRFVFAAKQLRGLPLHAPATRSANELSAQLLVHDQFLFAGQSGMVQAWLYPMLHPKYIVELKVVLNASRQVLKQLRVSLFLGKQHIEGRATRGKTIFRIPHPDFTKDISLDIEYIPHHPTRASKSTSKKN